MKKMFPFITQRHTNGMFRITSYFILFSAIFLSEGCMQLITVVQCDAGLKRTETEYGFGFTGLVGQELADEKTSVFGTASYHIYYFGDGYDYTGGHDNLLKVGVQARRSLANNFENFWVGGEAAYVRDKSVYDHAEWDNPVANGFSLGGLAGYKLPSKKLDASVFTGLSLIHFGDFKADGHVVDPSHNSVQFRVGVEVELSSLFGSLQQ